MDWWGVGNIFKDCVGATRDDIVWFIWFSIIYSTLDYVVILQDFYQEICIQYLSISGQKHSHSFIILALNISCTTEEFISVWRVLISSDRKQKRSKSKIDKGGVFLLHPFPRAWVDLLKKGNALSALILLLFVVRTESALVESLTSKNCVSTGVNQDWTSLLVPTKNHRCGLLCTTFFSETFLDFRAGILLSLIDDSPFLWCCKHHFYMVKTLYFVS